MLKNGESKREKEKIIFMATTKSKSLQIKKQLQKVIELIERGEEIGKVDYKKVIKLILDIIDAILNFWP